MKTLMYSKHSCKDCYQRNLVYLWILQFWKTNTGCLLITAAFLGWPHLSISFSMGVILAILVPFCLFLSVNFTQDTVDLITNFWKSLRFVPLQKSRKHFGHSFAFCFWWSYSLKRIAWWCSLSLLCMCLPKPSHHSCSLTTGVSVVQLRFTWTNEFWDRLLCHGLVTLCRDWAL